MNIALVVDPYGEKHPSGLGRSILEMAKGIVAHNTGDDFTVYIKKASVEPMPFEGNNWRAVPLNIERMWSSPARLFDRDIPLYIFFTPVMPIFFFPKQSIVVAHDFAYLEDPTRSFTQKVFSCALYILHWLSLHRATAIVAVSHAAKESIVSRFGIKPQKVTVIYNGFVAGDALPEEIETPQKFFLFAGVLKRRKNVLGVVEAFAEFLKDHPEWSLIVAGKKTGAYFAQVETLVRERGLEQRVFFPGYVTDGQLACLYTKAAALVFPSFIEGFGMPVLEAMHRGLPVITSNTGALAEVAGDAALLADPYNPMSIAEAMRKFADDGAVREHYAKLGQARASGFSWKKNAREFGSLIHQI